uniref:Axin_b-cat_bind domain-containing protein n=1 Tax=Schistocephalus solidus TaxID=70667 RepID=A0A183SR01_SCHSO
LSFEYLYLCVWLSERRFFSSCSKSCRSSSVENSYNAAPLRRPAPAVAGATESANGAEVVTASDLIAFMNATSEIQKPGLIGGGQATSQTAITGANESRKPHTNLAEVDPNAFVQTLSHRLEKVRESRGKMEKLLSRMQPIDAAESTALDSEFSGEKQQHPSQQLEGKDAAVNLPSRSFSREAGGRRRASSSSRFLMTPRASSAAVSGACLRKKLSALVCDDVDDAQVILEDHCSRIWTDEAGEEDLLQLNQSSVEPPTAICPPAALSQRKTHHHRFNPSSHHADVYSISSFDSGVVTCGGLNSSDSESCISRCQNQGTHNRGIYPGGGGGGKYASSSAHKRCFNFPPSTAVLAEDCFGSGGPGCAHNAPWNPALPPPPVCFFCQRPSMNSTPSANRKVPAYQGCWGGTGAYPGPPVYPNQYPEGLQSSRTIRSRSLTSDSPSVFDSGLSSTYDQLPVSRRPRQDASDQQSAETFDSLCTPIPSQMTRVGCPSKEVSDPLRLRDSSFHFPTEKPTINDCGPFVSCCINPTGPPFSPGDDNNLPYSPAAPHRRRSLLQNLPEPFCRFDGDLTSALSAVDAKLAGLLGFAPWYPIFPFTVLLLLPLLFWWWQRSAITLDPSFVSWPMHALSTDTDDTAAASLIVGVGTIGIVILP